MAAGTAIVIVPVARMSGRTAQVGKIPGIGTKPGIRFTRSVQRRIAG